MKDNYKLTMVHNTLNKKRLLYVMGIDWDWIFQRPQILEQHLEEQYDVTVIFPRSVRYLFKRMKGIYPAKYKILWTLPRQEKNPLLSLVSGVWAKKLFKNISQYDAVMLGYPLYYRYIPRSYTGKIIYDCMDNYEALYPDISGRKELSNQEHQLVKDCSAVIVTGKRLEQKVFSIVGGNSKSIILIRNGVCLKRKPLRQVPRSSQFLIGYFGTIAEWFDYEILLKSLEQFDDIEYHLIGPVLRQKPEESSRIVLEGVADHKSLPKITQDYACLIMPFVVNDVVEWVDPVKLYEYIALGKCVVSVKYDEIERFEDYVYFYTSHEEYLELIQELKNRNFPPKYTSEQQQTFLNGNSWQERFAALDKLIQTTLQ